MMIHNEPESQMEVSRGERNILYASLLRLYQHYALPSIATMLFFGLQAVVDGYIAGNYIGAYALGGVNIVSPIFSFLMVVSLSVGVGCQAIIGQALGANRLDEAQRAMSSGFWMLFALSGLSSIILCSYATDIARLMGADDRLAPYAIDYMRGLAPFFIPISLCFYSDMMLKVTGRPLCSSLVMGGAVVLNILLAFYFVVELGMGTYGTALSTGVSFSLALVASGWVTFNPRERLSMLAGRFDLRLIGRAVFNGSSEGIGELASGVSMLLINIVMMQRLGADGVSAYTTLNYLNFIGILFFLGLSDGLVPVMSYLYGAGRGLRLKMIVRGTLVTNIMIGIVVFVILQLWGDRVIGLFLHDQESLTFALATSGLRIYAFTFLLSGFNLFVTSFFTAIGNAVGSIVVALLRGLIFLVGGMLTLPALLGDSGLWLSIPLAELLTLFVTLALLVPRLRGLPSSPH